MNHPFVKRAFPPPVSYILAKKPGFMDLKEVFLTQGEIAKQCTEHQGELLLIESNYLFSPMRGIAAMGTMAMEETKYLLGKIDNNIVDDATHPHVFIPVGSSGHWLRRGNDVAHFREPPLHLDVYQLGASFDGNVFHHIIVGDDAVRDFLQELSRDLIRGGSQSLLMFWRVAKNLGTDISDWACIGSVLMNERECALKEYTRKVIDGASSKSGNIKLEGGIVTGKLFVPREREERLLWLGLSVEEIKVQARERIIAMLGL